MDDSTNINTEAPSQENVQEQELSHSDKMIGIFTEPTRTFEQTAKFPPRVIDWLLPLLILMFVVSAINTLLMNNPQIYYEAKEKAIKRIEQMNVASDRKEQMIDGVDKQMEMMKGPLGFIISFVSGAILGLIFFFIIVLIYFLLSRYALKGSGNFSSAMVPAGLVTYIGIVQWIIIAIISFVLSKQIMDTSIASFLNYDKSTLIGFVLGKLDVISIWSYSVLSIGLAKMFRSESVQKYFIMVFSLWIIGSFLIWLLAKALPILSPMAGF